MFILAGAKSLSRTETDVPFGDQSRLIYYVAANVWLSRLSFQASKVGNGM